MKETLETLLLALIYYGHEVQPYDSDQMKLDIQVRNILDGRIKMHRDWCINIT